MKRTPKKPKPNHAIKNCIIKDACEHFKVSESELLNVKRACLRTWIVMHAIYSEANYPHLQTSQVFGKNHVQASWRALKVQYFIRKGNKDGMAAIAFYQKYGYCKWLWEGRKAA